MRGPAILLLTLMLGLPLAPALVPEHDLLVVSAQTLHTTSTCEGPMTWLVAIEQHVRGYGDGRADVTARGTCGSLDLADVDCWMGTHGDWFCEEGEWETDLHRIYIDWMPIFQYEHYVQGGVVESAIGAYAAADTMSLVRELR